jgi:hypothetical protein
MACSSHTSLSVKRSGQIPPRVVFGWGLRIVRLFFCRSNGRRGGLEPCQLPFVWAADHCHITPPILAKDDDSCMTSHTPEQVMGTGTARQPTFRETRPRTLPAATALADLPPDSPSLETQAPKYMRLASPASTGVALSAFFLFLYASISPTHAFLFPPRPSSLPTTRKI